MNAVGMVGAGVKQEVSSNISPMDALNCSGFVGQIVSDNLDSRPAEQNHDRCTLKRVRPSRAINC